MIRRLLNRILSSTQTVSLNITEDLISSSRMDHLLQIKWKFTTTIQIARDVILNLMHNILTFMRYGGHNNITLFGLGKIVYLYTKTKHCTPIMATIATIRLPGKQQFGKHPSSRPTKPQNWPSWSIPTTRCLSVHVYSPCGQEEKNHLKGSRTLPGEVKHPIRTRLEESKLWYRDLFLTVKQN